MSKSTLLTFADLREEYRLPKSTVYLLIKEAGFPKQLKLGSRSVFFKRKEVDAWIDERNMLNAEVGNEQL